MILKTTHLRVLYLDGHLRYILCGNEEVLRMIYSAVRNSKWFTLPMTRTNEKIIQGDCTFSIQYTAHYKLDDISYEANIQIDGKANDTVSFQFIGKANSDFLSNRIGICTHHPLKECVGQEVMVIQPDGQAIHYSFSELIDPWPTFKQIRELNWTTPGRIHAKLTFSGDVFESEDQRNWSDASFKTYSTPVEIPYPVQIKKGEEIEQRVILSIRSSDHASAETKMRQQETRYPFPKIGYARSSERLNSGQINLLNQIIFDHYRVEIDFVSDWVSRLDRACQEATALNTTLELILFFDDAIREFEELKTKLNDNISSVIILEKGRAIASPALLNMIVPKIKNDFPRIQIGAGTNGHFADLNRSRDIYHGLDFIGYAVTPQAHLSDDLVLIENLEAQQYPIETLRSFTDKPIQISPVTLKSRDYPGLTIDERQHTELAARWTTLCLKYTAGVDQLTLFETIGPKGILNLQGPSPVFEVLKKISAFKPKFIIKEKETNPLKEDSLILENEHGERLKMQVCF